MPKIKTCRGAAKRFKDTGTGRIKRGKAFDGTSCRTRGASGNASSARRLSPVGTRNIRKLIPYL
jgi:large subunit ribosomal protein L35